MHSILDINGKKENKSTMDEPTSGLPVLFYFVPLVYYIYCGSNIN